MIRYVPVFLVPGGRLSFVRPEAGDPAALVAVACRWDTRPALDDQTGRLYLPRLRADFTAWGFVEAARRRLFRLRLRWEAPEPRPRAKRPRTRGRNQARAIGGVS